MARKIFKLFAGLILFVVDTKAQQLPTEKDLFNYEKNAFYPVAQKQPARFPFLIVVIPNRLRAYPTELVKLRKKIADSLYNLKNGETKEYRPNYTIVPSFDSSKALVFVQGINRRNANEYEYRITEGNKTNTWNAFENFYLHTYQSGVGENDSEMATLGYLGTNWNNYLMIDVRRKNSDTIISSAIICWMNHPPKVIATFSPDQLDKFFALFQNRSRGELLPYEFPMIDSLLKTKKEFASGENSIVFYLDDIQKQKLTEYKLQGPDLNTEWKLNDMDFNFIWLKDLKPGKYKLMIRYSIQRQNVTIYDFEIKPAWQQTTGFKIIAGGLVAAFFGFIVTVIRNRNQKQMLLKQELEKEKSEIELKAIRAQLNPHFVHNSLSSIQSLLTKNDISKANKYLLAFSRLMRETLISGDRNFNSLAYEINILETYLTLEQLRFGFHFEIKIASEINTETIEIPSLLPQPLVENAVRHGVANLKENGMITVQFCSEKKDLLITISDNGKGFTETAKNGYGLKLTTDRINLVNRSLPDQPVKLDIQSKKEGTIIFLAFKNWLT